MGEYLLQGVTWYMLSQILKRWGNKVVLILIQGYTADLIIVKGIDL